MDSIITVMGAILENTKGQVGIDHPGDTLPLWSLRVNRYRLLMAHTNTNYHLAETPINNTKIGVEREATEALLAFF